MPRPAALQDRLRERLPLKRDRAPVRIGRRQGEIRVLAAAAKERREEKESALLQAARRINSPAP